jgi:cell division protein FtsB
MSDGDNKDNVGHNSTNFFSMDTNNENSLAQDKVHSNDLVNAKEDGEVPENTVNDFTSNKIYSKTKARSVVVFISLTALLTLSIFIIFGIQLHEYFKFHMFKDELSQKEAELGAIKTQILDSTDDLRKQQKLTNSIKNLTDTFTMKLTELEEISQKFAKYEARVASLGNDEKTLLQNIEDQNKLLKEKQAENAKLEEQKNKLSKEVDAIDKTKKSLAGITEKLEKIIQLVNDKEAELQKIEAKITNRQELLSRLETKFTATQKELDIVEGRYEAQSKAYDELNKARDTLKNEINNAQINKTKIEADIAGLEGMRQEHISLSERINRGKKEYNGILNDVKVEGEHLNALKEEKARLALEIEENKSELERIKLKQESAKQDYEKIIQDTQQRILEPNTIETQKNRLNPNRPE